MALIGDWEGCREWAYPDPASKLAKATFGQKWGFVNALEILAKLPSSIASLPGDPWTIGFGATGDRINPGLRWSQEVAQVNLEDRIETDLIVIKRMVYMPAHPWEFAAFSSFAYNVGLDDDEDTKPEGFGDSTLLKKFNAGDKEGCADEFLKWVYAGGKKLQGLENRRRDERSMFLGTHPLIVAII